MDEEKFKSERKTALGGSDMSDLFEIIEEGGCKKRLYFEKSGIEPDYEPPLWLQKHAKRGRKLEHIIGEEYSEITRRVVIPIGEKFIRHPDYPFIANHMDFETYDEQGNQRYLETKCPSYGVFKQIKKNGLKQGWILQIHQGMLAGEKHGFIGGSCAVHNVDTWTTIYFDIEEDKEIRKIILDECIDFWHRLEKKIIPEGFPPQDTRCRKCEYRWRCHKNATAGFDLSIINDKYEPDIETISLINEILEFQDIEDEAHTLTEEAKNRLRTALEHPTKFTIKGGAVSYSKFNKNTWDHDALNAYMAKNPSINKMFEKFRKKMPQERLTVERI
jgi:predicted phage-related endonuclease